LPKIAVNIRKASNKKGNNKSKSGRGRAISGIETWRLDVAAQTIKIFEEFFVKLMPFIRIHA
jgi:hypothetical protein